MGWVGFKMEFLWITRHKTSEVYPKTTRVWYHFICNCNHNDINDYNDGSNDGGNDEWDDHDHENEEDDGGTFGRWLEVASQERKSEMSRRSSPYLVKTIFNLDVDDSLHSENDNKK